MVNLSGGKESLTLRRSMCLFFPPFPLVELISLQRGLFKKTAGTFHYTGVIQKVHRVHAVFTEEKYCISVF